MKNQKISLVKYVFLLFPFLFTGCSLNSLSENASSSSSNSKSSLNTTNTNYFEGEIIYSIEYDSVPSYISEDYLKNSVGAKLKFIFKSGNHKKKFYNSERKLISQRILNLQEGISYSKSISEDTVYWVDIKKNDSRSSFKIKEDTIIDNYDCLRLRVDVTTPNPRLPNENLKIFGEYFYAKSLPINPKWFANYYEGDYNLITEQTRCLMIEKNDFGPFWNTRYICDTIKWRKVDDSELSTKFLKKYPKIEL